MRIVHKSINKAIETNIRDPAGFMITNGKGSYFSEGIKSRYSGFFCYTGREMYRILDSIDCSAASKIVHNQWNVDCAGESNQKRFFMPEGYDVLVCLLKKAERTSLRFDIRKSYDLRKWGKEYRIYEENDGAGDYLVVEFTKNTDKREDDSQGRTEEKFYVAICGNDMKYKLPDKWIKEQYDFDKKRGSLPEEWYVYEGMDILSEEIIISAAKEKQEAIDNARYVKHNLKSIIKKEKDKARDLFARKGFGKEIEQAYHLAAQSIKALCIKDDDKQKQGIFAGLPWFFQSWTRDEAICLKSLMLLKEYKFCNEILEKQLGEIGDSGRVPNRIPSTELGSADGTGWMFARCADLRDIIEKSKDSAFRKKYFSNFFKGYVKGQIEKSITKLCEADSKEGSGFAINGPQETWMDTVWENDNRSGARIEIQALRLSMYKIAYELSGKEKFKELEKRLKEKVREHFWNGSYLADGLDDWTIRPNVFIAAYIYPELLSKNEWKKCFKAVIPKLWLSWGGLSTIDKNHPLFCENYSGEIPKSYHRGDSWFWINNLAAIVMVRVDKKGFKTYIDRIIDASAKDIMYKGFIGHHSELSSASKQKAEGSLCQAWSSAMFVELVHELYQNKIP